MATHPPRVGLFGEFGCGNLGNEGSLDAALGAIRERHPNWDLTGIFRSTENSRRRFGVPAVQLTCPRRGHSRWPRLYALAVRIPGKFLDLIRMIVIMGNFDLVLVPGTGIWEESMGTRPWGSPWALVTLTVAARLRGTALAFVSIGASKVSNPITRSFLRVVGNGATYRSFRDVISRDAATSLGVDTARDEVFCDLTYALPNPLRGAATDVVTTVGVGVIAYAGSFPDTARGNAIHTRYVGQVVEFVSWLAVTGYQVRMLTGDISDGAVARHVRDVVVERHPAAAGAVTFPGSATMAELMEQMADVDVVVASRYHNVVAAVKMIKPLIAVGYAEKSRSIMTRLDLPEFYQNIDDLSAPLLIEQFHEVCQRRIEIADRIRVDTKANEERVLSQFDELTRILP